MKCESCSHFLLDQDSIHVNLTDENLTATATYNCRLGLLGLIPKPDCLHYSGAYIEDSITWKRGVEFRK